MSEENGKVGVNAPISTHRIASRVVPESVRKPDAAAALRQSDSKKEATLAELAARQEVFKQAVTDINKALSKIPTSLSFQVDESSNRFVVNVADLRTGELLRQIPGDAVLRIARQLESLKGIIFDDKY
jgi:flagellar protein FlaG